MRLRNGRACEHDEARVVAKVVADDSSGLTSDGARIVELGGRNDPTERERFGKLSYFARRFSLTRVLRRTKSATELEQGARRVLAAEARPKVVIESRLQRTLASERRAGRKPCIGERE